MEHSAPTAAAKMFASSSAALVEAHFCFNKAQFTRSDFDVQRFMKITRRRADLKQIHHDLRLYLKSIQNSMVELINDDYAHFVNLSSNLVALKDSIDKIDNSIKNSWKDFMTSAADAVAQAERVEARCTELAANRDTQVRLRSQIAVLAALKRLSAHLRSSSNPSSQLWLERLNCLVVDAVVFADSLDEGSTVRGSYERVMQRVEAKLGDETVASLRGDCSLLPLTLSALSLSSASERLTSRIVADVIEPRLKVEGHADKHKLLVSVLDQVKQLRSEWKTCLGAKFVGPVATFLDHSLLTHVLSFTDKSLGVIMAGTEPALFHSCFSTMTAFIASWPSAASSRVHLKAISERFILRTYFTVLTTKWSTRVEKEQPPTAFAQVPVAERKKKGEEEEEEEGSSSLECLFSRTLLSAIRATWAEDAYLPPLAHKSWEFTMKMLGKFLSWIRAIREHYSDEGCNLPEGMPAWLPLLCARVDAPRLPQLVFDQSLETIWPRLRDFGVDTTPFGQTLTAFSGLLAKEAALLDSAVVELFSKRISVHLDAVSQVPKQYRWTKKPSPTTASAYITAAAREVEEWRAAAEGRGHDTEQLLYDIWTRAALDVAGKAADVLDTVEATGSSLSRLKRREGAGAAGEGGETDEDKIRMQISIDLEEMKKKLRGREGGEGEDALAKVLARLAPTRDSTPPASNAIREPSA